MMTASINKTGEIEAIIKLTPEYVKGGHLNPQAIMASLTKKKINFKTEEVIAAYDVDPAIGAISHELMHAVLKQKDITSGKIIFSPAFESFQRIFYIGKNDATAVTQYANSYPSIKEGGSISTYLTRQYEDFCDVMTLYKTAPELLRKLDPEKYAFAELIYNGSDDPSLITGKIVTTKSEEVKQFSSLPPLIALVSLKDFIPGVWLNKNKRFIQERRDVWGKIESQLLKEEKFTTKIKTAIEFTKNSIREWKIQRIKSQSGNSK